MINDTKSSGSGGGSSSGSAGGSGGGSQQGGSSSGSGGGPNDDTSGWAETDPTALGEPNGIMDDAGGTELFGNLGQDPPTDPRYEPPE